MCPLIDRRRASWSVLLLLLGALGALPAVSRAADPVDQLRDALKIEIELDGDRELAKRRNKLIEAVIPELKTVSQLRRGYFLKEWSQHVKSDPPDKVLDIDPYRATIGDQLSKAVRAAAADANPDRQVAIAIVIAQIADSDTVEVRTKEDLKPKEDAKARFARSLTDVACLLAKDPDIAVRQAGLHALGKIPPNAAEVFPIFNDTLKKDELGPRRLAAYALNDLIKNTRSLERQEKLPIIEQVLSTAGLALRDNDEPVRGYSLQAIQASAKVIADFYSSAEELSAEVKGKRTLNPDLQKTLRAYAAVNPQLLLALRDPQPNVRLAALRTLEQIGNARGKIIFEVQKLYPEKRLGRGEALKSVDAPDPLIGTIGALEKIKVLLNENDVRLRRGAIDFLELLGDQAAPALPEITEALRDSDRSVRWSAARTMRHIPPQKVSATAIRSLGTLLIDPDPDVSAAAAAALEALGPAAADAVDWLGFVIANGDADNRNWDTENRVAALKALVSIGGKSAQRGIPHVLSALRDPDVRVRREAASVLGRLGVPDDEGLVQQMLTALRRALNDEDGEVRLSASEAILAVAPPRKKL